MEYRETPDMILRSEQIARELDREKAARAVRREEEKKRHEAEEARKKAEEAKRTAEWLQLTVEQVMKAAEYIAEHREEVMANDRKIIERHAKGNPTEIVEKHKGTHERFMARVAELRASRKSLPSNPWKS